MSAAAFCARGGRIRIGTPDLQVIAALYNTPRTQKQNRYISEVLRIWRQDYQSAEIGVIVNNIFGFGHRFIYDPGTMSESLTKAGFSVIKQCEPGQTDIPSFQGMDRHAGDTDYVKFETFFLEATKPA